jgi:hypothetical protein
MWERANHLCKDNGGVGLVHLFAFDSVNCNNSMSGYLGKIKDKK